ncbi:pyruvate kinase [bacterium]|nr:pyruvate kinase [bacterium]MBU1883017.1 pyruvate kinase [bacterium]
MKKRTKILATLGPASETLEKIIELMRAGVNVFRLNFSHGTYEYHEKVLSHVREASRQTGLVVGVLQDISGPKIRIGELEESFNLEENDTIIFHKKHIIGKKTAVDKYEVSINYPQILSQLKNDDYIYLYDGIIRTKVISCTDESVTVLVENQGMLSSKKGVNFPSTRLGVDVLTKKDMKDMQWGVKNGVDFMAISFVQNENDMLKARGIINELGGKQMLIAKIEKFDAVENIDAILEVSDGIMVARGDLGIEVPYYEVPNIQKMLIRKANAASKPVITATQMLLSMTYSQRATRAEISDIANAVLDGTDAVMLSEESAVGEYPVLAVQTMFETIVETEKEYPYYQFDYTYNDDVTNAIDESAVRLSRDLNVTGILSLTSSGSSARKLAKYHPDKPIYGITHDDRVRQQLTLSWGVVPVFSVQKNSLGQTLRDVIIRGLKDGVLDLKKSYILTAGDPTGVSGSINMIRLLRKQEMEFFTTIAANKC